jgi:hypothetical protein
VVHTENYTADLSKLNGSFQIHEDQSMESSEPENVQVQNQFRQVSLAQLSAEGHKPDSRLLLTQNTPPVVAPLPPPPQMQLRAASNPPPPAPASTLVFPEVQANPLNLYTAGPLEKALAEPLPVPVVWKSIDNDWKAILQISGSGKKVVLTKSVEQGRMIFTLEEIRSLHPARWGQTWQFTLEPGLMREAGSKPEIRLSGRRTSVQLTSLDIAQPITLAMDQWNWQNPDTDWFGPIQNVPLSVQIKVVEPRVLRNLIGFLRGARNFTLSRPDPGATWPIHVVKDNKIVLSLSAIDKTSLQSLQKVVQGDLVFQGSAQAFIGGQERFFLENFLNRKIPIYYTYRGKLVRLDAGLVNTREEARAFIEKVNPFFFSEPAVILDEGPRS